jgi:hypothetical protein
MTDKNDFFGIGITPQTEAELFALHDEFQGRLSDGSIEPRLVTDDQLVALLLGWHLRRRPSLFGVPSLKNVIDELIFRAAEDFDADLPGAEDDAANWSDVAEAKTRRESRKRSIKSTPGYVLTIDGIDKRTPQRIIARAQAVEKTVKTIETSEMKAIGLGEEELVRLLFVRHSDQEIIDLWMYFRIQHWVSDELEEFPLWALDEVVRRGADPSLSVKSKPVNLAQEITDRKRKVAQAFDDIQTPNPGAISTFRAFENEVRILCSEIGLGAIPTPSIPPVSLLTSPIVDTAIAFTAEGKRVPSEAYAKTLVPLETRRPKIEEIAARRAAEGLITTLLARMIEASESQVLAITSEKENSGPYVTTSRTRPGFTEVSFVSNFTRLEDKERQISILLTILGWTAQLAPSSPVVVYTKAWKDTVPTIAVAADVAIALVYVLYVGRQLPSWFYTSITGDSLIEELANSLPVRRFDGDETQAMKHIADAQREVSVREKIILDASRERVSAEMAVAYSPLRSEIGENYIDNLVTKLDRRMFYAPGQQVAIKKLLDLFPSHRL